MRRLTPHLCNLLSANQFFDTLKRRPGRVSAFPYFLPLSADGRQPISALYVLVKYDGL